MDCVKLYLMDLQRCSFYLSTVSLQFAAESWHLARNSLPPAWLNFLWAILSATRATSRHTNTADSTGCACLTWRPTRLITPRVPPSVFVPRASCRVECGRVNALPFLHTSFDVLCTAVLPVFALKLSPPYKQGPSSSSSSSPVSSFSHPLPTPLVNRTTPGNAERVTGWK